ncbi:MAG: serine protease [Candidatus Electrothrix aestuarii]|uniref:Serine protease n=1 Tax=Candidatus Electrothrix aestuarii TaxID=3062594 RepID=A0AAU8LSV1_9BACT|nr:serine protease [Candidatus Electrothrix aestuarii]
MIRQAAWKFDEFFVWIHNHHKQIIGAGFLIGGKEIATCAHVIRDALRLHSTPGDAPEGDIVLSFPSSEQDSEIQKDEQYLLATAHADGWDKQKDIAILQLQSELSKGARPARLSDDKRLEGHSFRVYGFPGKTAKGVWAYGTIKDQRENGQVQLESAAGYAVQGGFSGGPVLDDELKKVVGMIVTSDESVRVASMISVDMLTTICSQARVTLELDEEKGGNVMNISPREICENCLKASFSGMQKQELISIAKNRIPDIGNAIEEHHTLYRIFSDILDYYQMNNNFSEFWGVIKEKRENQWKKFYPEWRESVQFKRI